MDFLYNKMITSNVLGVSALRNPKICKYVSSFKRNVIS